MSSEEQPPNEAVAQLLKPSPWDVRAFNMPCSELAAVTAESLALTRSPGHYTAKIDPVDDTSLLHANGFYYCDTLMEPFCRPEMFRPAESQDVSISDDCSLEELLAVSDGAYRHGRFHRDFNIPDHLADLRYDNWVRDLHGSGNCFGLLYQGELAAYFGMAGGKAVLHAVDGRFRGKGLAKFLWSAAYVRLFKQGYAEVSSSVSTPNTAVVNLYASLGFRFRNPVDIYHKYVAGTP